jgi:hypothetical protein
MNRIEVQYIIGYIEVLWRDWKPTDEELRLWAKNLLPFNEDSSCLAIDQYKITKSGGFNKPKLYDVLGLCKSYQLKMHFSKKDEDDDEPALTYKVRCVEHIEPKMIGQEIKVYCTHRKPSPPDYIIASDAERMAEKAQETYSGRWVFVRVEELEPAPF